MQSLTKPLVKFYAVFITGMNGLHGLKYLLSHLLRFYAVFITGMNGLHGLKALLSHLLRFYAVFTTGMNGLHGSAVCTFKLDDVTMAFEGKFKVT